MNNKKKDKYGKHGYIKLEEARFPVPGVFESMRSYRGRIFKITEHVSRLYESARTSGLKILPGKDVLTKKITDKLRQSGLKDAYIRAGLSGTEAPRLDIIIKPLTGYPPEYYRQGVSVVTAAGRKNIPSAVEHRIKSADFLWGVMGKIESFCTGAFEVLLLNHQGYVVEGSVSNIFLIKDGRIITPPPNVGILEGITAGTVMELARRMPLKLSRQPVTRHELYNAQEVFLTNTTMEIMPVSVIDGRHIASPCPGKVTRRLCTAYRELAYG